MTILQDFQPAELTVPTLAQLVHDDFLTIKCAS